MSLLTNIANVLKESPPSHVFELSEAGIAFARPAGTEFETGFAPFEPGTLVISPMEDNIRRADLVAAQIARIAPVPDAKRRRPASLILPDYAARVSVLDFDSLPAKPEEQLALVRFRLKKTLPFDIDSAALELFRAALGRGSSARGGGRQRRVSKSSRATRRSSAPRRSNPAKSPRPDWPR